MTQNIILLITTLIYFVILILLFVFLYYLHVKKNNLIGIHKISGIKGKIEADTL